MVTRIWEMIGYLVAPDIMAKKFFLLQGPSNTGKSVLGRFIQNIFPKGQVTGLSLSQLGDANLPAEFMGSRLNLSMDLSNNKTDPKAIERIKLLTGNDLISQNIKYKDNRSYNGQCKFLFSTNHPIRLKQWKHKGDRNERGFYGVELINDTGVSTYPTGQRYYTV